LIFVLAFVSRDFELGRNLSCKESTVSPVRCWFIVFSFFLFFLFLCRALDLTGHFVSFWAHVNRIVSYRTVLMLLLLLIMIDDVMINYCVWNFTYARSESQSVTTRSCSTFSCCCQTSRTSDSCSVPRDTRSPTFRCLHRCRSWVMSAMLVMRLRLRMCRLVYWLQSVLCRQNLWCDCRPNDWYVITPHLP